MTEVGDSLYSEDSDWILTKPCSPPENLVVVQISSTSINFRWDKPMRVGLGVKIADYEVQVTQGILHYNNLMYI